MRLTLAVVLWFFGMGVADAKIDFDATDDTIIVDSSATIDNQQPLTFASWIRPEGAGETAGRWFNKGAIGAASGGVIVNLFDSGKEMTWNVDCDTTDMSYSTGGDMLTVNAWQAVVVTWDGGTDASDSAHMYVNGAEVTYQDTGTNCATSVVSEAGENLHIGNRPATDRTFDGQITEFCMWDKVLDAQEISLYSRSRVKGICLQIAPSNLVLYPDMSSCDGACTAAMVDLSQNDNTITPTNNPTGSGETVSSYP